MSDKNDALYAFRKYGESEARELVLMKGKIFDEQTWATIATRMIAQRAA